MLLTSFIKGLVIGFSIAAPVGPIGVLCIRRSLAHGPKTGFVTGLGAATADVVYGAIAGFGLTAITNVLVGQKLWLGILGGIFLCYLGLRTFIARPAEAANAAEARGLLAAYGSTLALTLTNPATILSFAAVFVGIGGVGSYSGASMLVAGVFLGSAAWWLTLSFGIGMFRSRVTTAHLRLVNRLSGLILFGFGVFAFAMAFR